MSKVIGLCCSCHKEILEDEKCYINNSSNNDIYEFYCTRLVIYDVSLFNKMRTIYHTNCFEKMLKNKGIKIKD